jgi:hypothetical protein
MSGRPLLRTPELEEQILDALRLDGRAGILDRNDGPLVVYPLQARCKPQSA